MIRSRRTSRLPSVRFRSASLGTVRIRDAARHLASPVVLTGRLWMAVAVVMTTLGWLQAAEPSSSLQFGIDGHYRVGRWTPVRTDDRRPIETLETRDGDGVQVRYAQSGTGSVWAYAIPGSEAAPLLAMEDNQVIATGRFPTVGSPSRGPAMIPREMPWVVALGDPLTVDEIGANELLDRDALIAVSQPASSEDLPDSLLGYEGVDLMMIGGSGEKILRGLAPSQHAALVNWIKHGGRVLLTLGESAPALAEAAPWIKSLLPLEEISTLSIDPSALETYTSTQTPLESFVGVALPIEKGRVRVLGRTVARKSTPIAVDYNVGFGRITVVAADLEREPFASWPNRLDLVTQLTGSLLVPELRQQQRRTRATAYDDLAGQLRATLDQFEIKRRYQFSVVSIVLMVLIAALGPLDYLLINRVFGRPLLGWLSFPLFTIGLSALLYLQARPVDTSIETAPRDDSATHSLPRSPLVQCNRIEIVDIDTVDGTGRGFSASYLYAHHAARFDVKVNPSAVLRSVAGEMDKVLTSPFGYPGQSYGGIQIAIEDTRLPVYRVELHRDASADALQYTTLDGLPLASRSSKGFSTTSQFTPDVTEVNLSRRPGSELLQGELINPLSVDLLDGMLVYRNWAYMLPTRFPAGGRIASIDSLQQKNFRWQLSRQRALESASESEAWDPADRESLSRVAEMLMFHRAVGGARYTGLEHDPLRLLDLTHVLSEDRCILIGRVDQPLTDLRLQASTEATQEVTRDASFTPPGERLSLLRIVLPVTQ